jgi:hypothetical protein
VIIGPKPVGKKNGGFESINKTSKKLYIEIYIYILIEGFEKEGFCQFFIAVYVLEKVEGIV